MQQVLFSTTEYALVLVPALGIGEHDIVTAVPYQNMLHLVLYPNGSVTNGNRPLNIVSYLKPDQSIVLSLVPGQTIVLQGETIKLSP